MEIRFKDIGPETLKTELLVVPVCERRLEETSIRALDRRLKGRLQERIQKGKFAATEGSSLLYSTAASTSPSAMAASEHWTPQTGRSSGT